MSLMVPADLRGRLEMAAAAEHRSLNQQCIRFLARAVAQYSTAQADDHAPEYEVAR
jgi:predicted HicB family RNase H-like nuclease